MPTFVLWGISHQIVLLLTTIAIFAIRWVRFLPRRQQHAIRWSIAIVLISHIISYHVWHLHHDTWDITYSLPLHLCWLSNYLTIVTLITLQPRLMQITYYLGAWSALAAMLLPAVPFGFPTFDFFEFFISHAFILIGIAYICWVEKVRMTYQNLWVSGVILLLISPLAHLVNLLTGANYLFLRGIPNTESFLPASPYHLPIVAVAVLLCLHLQYLPYGYRRSR